MAVNLRFCAKISKRKDGQVLLKIRDEKNAELQSNTKCYYKTSINLNVPIVYEYKRDYLKSVFQVLLRLGYAVKCGFNI